MSIFVLAFGRMTLTLHHLGELDAAAHQLLADGRDTPVWLLRGEMGAGKTTLIKALCRALGVVSVVQSPTFGLINEYTTGEGRPVYHFDCYRLRNELEAYDVGMEEYFDSGAYCFVEWPDRVAALWPARCYQVTLRADPSGVRHIVGAPILL
jgi:tRNA threonylcarbamoyladenosine biosynthesis protein TsaE